MTTSNRHSCQGAGARAERLGAQAQALHDLVRRADQMLAEAKREVDAVLTAVYGNIAKG